MIMYPHSKPFGYINCKCIKAVAQTKNGYYIVDDCSNCLTCDIQTFNDLLDRNYPLIKLVRKGV